MKIENEILSDVHDSDMVNGEFIIPNSVIEIGYEAFSNCNNLSKIFIPNSVTKIGVYAFSNCTKLVLIDIPNSVIEIGGWAFSNCINLKSIIIPDSVNVIKNFAFSNCNNLISITVPDSVIEIGDCVFYNCFGLQSKEGNYKGFNKGLTCMDMQYIPNEWNKIDGDIKICKRGLHYVTNLFDIFSYYYGDLEEDIEIWEVEVGDIIVDNEEDSKKATNAIFPKHKLAKQEIINILNNK